MRKFFCAALLGTLLTGFAWTPAADAMDYGPWRYSSRKGYHYQKCSFEGGGHQYLIFYPNKPGWVYWYNPKSQKFWLACPTKYNRQYGERVLNGEELFLRADKPGATVAETEFPQDIDGSLENSGSAKNAQGIEEDLGCPDPDDIPEI